MTEASDPISEIEQFTYYLKNPDIFKDVKLCKTQRKAEKYS